MEKLLTPLLLLSLWCVEFTTAQDFNCSTPDQLRLNQADEYFELGSGRVEICSCDFSGGCQWVTIPLPTTYTSWGWKNAEVACREIYLEDYGVFNPILQDTLLPDLRASSEQSVLSYTIYCDGSEDRIIDCSSQPSSEISHSRDAHIRCRTVATAPMEGDVRLTGVNSDQILGIVEFYIGGRGWFTGCIDSWDSEDANVTCIALGYESGAVTFYSANANTPPIGVYQVSCSGSESDLTLCTYSTVGSCSNSNVRAGVICSASELGEGSARLFPSEQTGGYDQRVEVLYDGRWGSVCHLDWDIEDGTVACNSIGGGSASIDDNPNYATMNGARPIWLTRLACDGSESRLSECLSSFPVGYARSCSHLVDAALACNDGGLSGGEIAGIVIGCLVFLGGIGFFIHISEQNKKKRIAAHQRQQHEAAAAAAAATAAAASAAAARTNAAREEATRPARETTAENAAQQTTGASSDNASALARVESDTDLRRGAPPSYDDALRFTEALSDAKTPLPPTQQSEKPEVPAPPYPVPEASASHPTTGNLNLPYPDTSSGATPYPPVSTVGVPYPHVDIASAPYLPAQVPYPQAPPGPGNIQSYPPPTNPGYPPPTNPGYPPPTNPGHPPPTNPAFPSAPPIGYPTQPFTTPTYDPNQPVQDIGTPLPPALQPYEESSF